MMPLSFSCRAFHWPFWAGFLGPFLCLYVFDWIMFIIILVSIIRNKIKSNKDKYNAKKNNSKLKNESLVMALILAVTFGLGWGFGLLATTYPHEGVTITFQIIFAILVSSQGILLFSLHVMRNVDARNIWKNLLKTVTPIKQGSTKTTKLSTPNPLEIGLISAAPHPPNQGKKHEQMVH